MYSRYKTSPKQKKIIEQQKRLVAEKQREVLNSIKYAKRYMWTISQPKKIASLLKRGCGESKTNSLYIALGRALQNLWCAEIIPRHLVINSPSLLIYFKMYGTFSVCFCFFRLYILILARACNKTGFLTYFSFRFYWRKGAWHYGTERKKSRVSCRKSLCF
jgi:hypothetical protein